MPLFAVKSGSAIDGITFEEFSVIGDGTTAISDDACFTNPSGCVLKNIRYSNLKIKGVSFAIYLNADFGGSIDNAVVENCYISDIFGQTSGNGVGVAVANGRNTDGNITVRNNIFDNCGRHSIYINHGKGVIVSGNTVLNHGQRDTEYLYGNAGIDVTRSENVIVENNIIDNCRNRGIAVETDTAVGMIRAFNIAVRHNIIKNGSNEFSPYIMVGTDTPDDNGYVKNIDVVDNMLIVGSSVGCYYPILVQSGINVNIKGNFIDMTNFALPYSRGIDLYGYGSTYPSDDYIVEGNLIFNNPNGENTRGINIAPNISDGTMNIQVLNNYLDASEQYAVGGDQTNTNMKVMWRQMWNIPYISDLSPSADVSAVVTWINDFRTKLINCGMVRI